jgi:hypothetical protein
MIEYKVGLRLISNDNTKGVIIKILSIGKFIREPNIIIEWEKPKLIGVMALDLKEKNSKVKYTKSMLDESFSEGVIKIDKGYYRNKKLNELGI